MIEANFDGIRSRRKMRSPGISRRERIRPVRWCYKPKGNVEVVRGFVENGYVGHDGCGERKESEFFQSN